MPAYAELFRQQLYVYVYFPSIASVLTVLNGKSRRLLSFFRHWFILLSFSATWKIFTKILNSGCGGGQKTRHMRVMRWKMAKSFVWLKWQNSCANNCNFAYRVTRTPTHTHIQRAKPQGQNLFINKPTNQITRVRERTRSKVLWIHYGNMRMHLSSFSLSINLRKRIKQPAENLPQKIPIYIY